MSVWLVACSSVAPVPVTSTPTRHPKTYQWDANPVLIQVYEGPGYMEPDEAWGFIPRLLVYSDGHVIVSSQGSGLAMQSFETYISPTEVCSLLEKIDQAGFFDFDKDTYQAPDILDGVSTLISVDAWRSKSVDVYMLSRATAVPSVLEKVSSLLLSYHPQKLIPYQPDRVALFINDRLVGAYPDANHPDTSWPASLPSLESVTPILGSKEERFKILVFDGNAATEITKFFGNAPYKNIVDDRELYFARFKPVFPYETTKSITRSWEAATFDESPKTRLTCTIR